MGLKEKIIQKLASIAEDSEIFKELNRQLFPCQHVVKVQKPPKNSLDYDDYDLARCEKCKAYMSWYCPDSPDHQCHYFSHPNSQGEPVINLLDGTEVKVLSINPQHSVEYESDDFCLYCGCPEERK